MARRCLLRWWYCSASCTWAALRPRSLLSVCIVCKTSGGACDCLCSVSNLSQLLISSSHCSTRNCSVPAFVMGKACWTPACRPLLSTQAFPCRQPTLQSCVMLGTCGHVEGNGGVAALQSIVCIVCTTRSHTSQPERPLLQAHKGSCHASTRRWIEMTRPNWWCWARAGSRS